MTELSAKIIRYRAGATALMRVDKVETRCGYKQYIGLHITGEQIIVPETPACREANEQEKKLWQSYERARVAI